MLGETPLNAVELGEAIINDDENLTFINLLNRKTNNSYSRWIDSYLYHLDTSFKKDGIEQTIMLVPIGAKEPTIFQRKYKLDIDVYINSKTAFYPKLKCPLNIQTLMKLFSVFLEKLRGEAIASGPIVHIGAST